MKNMKKADRLWAWAGITNEVGALKLVMDKISKAKTEKEKQMWIKIANRMINNAEKNLENLRKLM